jgi:amino acid transporter
MCFPFLSFLSLSSGSSQVLTWLINLITAGGIIDYIVMSATYLAFYKACKVQGLDRTTLPYYGYFQPYSGWIGLCGMTLIVFTYGYSSFSPWSNTDFWSHYAMVVVSPVLFLGWKLFKNTRRVRPSEADLVWERPVIDAYEASFMSPPVGFWTEIVQLVGFRREKIDRRRESVEVVAMQQNVEHKKNPGWKNKLGFSRT